MTLRLEKLYPIIFAILATFAWWRFSRVIPPDEKEFLGAALSIGSILTGFITTAKAILIALPSDSIIGRLRSSGYINELVSYLASALYGCFFFSIFCLFGFFLLVKDRSALPEIYGAAWVFLAVYSAFSFYRISNFLFSIIRNPK